MNLEELDANINQHDKSVEVNNADMLAALVIIQGELRKIEKLITENQKINQKSIADIKATLENHDKNISAIPVLTSNITTEKINNIASDINNGNVNVAASAKALNESNAAFRTYMYAWFASLALFFIVILFLIFGR